ncbi:hypothetical protein CSOJ01_06539 [Colletotrichum sojae]|uniref:Uncharacterized protein n=1 Tax=Colletotrichum sojae TaxID=2175907 RepID=A0A8H6JBW3_9PEZI|nr:hypothetical protein CSOJ01_06539 [Colletotrichum sojae]
MLTTVKVTVNPNQESSTARPAKVVYYTPTPEPPKRPSSYQAPLSEPQDPEPSEAAYIYFEWNEYTDFYEGDKKPSAQWQMLPRTLDNMYHIICRVTPVASVLATVKEPTRSPGRPPSFSAVTDIWGRNNCKYTGGRAEDDPGKFSCDGVPEFDCYADPQEGEGINCSTEAGQERYYIPRVRCEFPAGKKTRVSHSDKNNNGGWRPTPESWGV